jgi:hypothetical protein
MLEIISWEYASVPPAIGFNLRYCIYVRNSWVPFFFSISYTFLVVYENSLELYFKHKSTLIEIYCEMLNVTKMFTLYSSKFIRSLMSHLCLHFYMIKHL